MCQGNTTCFNLNALGKGPFEIIFKEFFNDGNKPVYTDFQIDGEFMRLMRPRSLTIQHSPDLPGGKIKILVRN